MSLSDYLTESKWITCRRQPPLYRLLSFTLQTWCRILLCSVTNSAIHLDASDVGILHLALASFIRCVSVSREIAFDIPRSLVKQLGPLPGENDRKRRLCSQEHGGRWRLAKRRRVQQRYEHPVCPFTRLNFQFGNPMRYSIRGCWTCPLNYSS